MDALIINNRDFDQVFSQERNRIFYLVNHYFDTPPIRIRQEIITRFDFAKKQGERYFKDIVNASKSGNVVGCKARRKFTQACRVYDYYQNEFINPKI